MVRELQPHLTRLLLVQANPRLAERLREDWPAGPPAGVHLWEEPIGPRSEEVTWYRYNDPRLDGPLPPDQLSARFRNLSLLGEERRQQRTLADLVTHWWESSGTPEGEGALLLQGPDPGAVLAGAAPLLPHLERVVCWLESGGRREPVALP